MSKLPGLGKGQPEMYMRVWANGLGVGEFFSQLTSFRLLRVLRPL